MVGILAHQLLIVDFVAVFVSFLKGLGQLLKLDGDKKKFFKRLKIYRKATVLSFAISVLNDLVSLLK